MKTTKLLFFILLIVTGLIVYKKISKSIIKQKSQNNETFIIGTSADFYPFSFLKNNEIQGFDIDIAMEVSKTLGKDIKIKNLDFEMLIPELQLGNIHIISAGLTPTPQRAERVLFTEPYINDGPLTVVTVKPHTISKIEDLNGKEVIVNDGFTSEQYISKFNNIIMKKLPTMIDAFLALDNGRAFAFVATKNTLKPFVKQNGDKYNFFEIEGTDQTSAIAVSKKFPQLFEQIQSALNKLIQSGRIEELKKKWDIQ